MTRAQVLNERGDQSKQIFHLLFLNLIEISSSMVWPASDPTTMWSEDKYGHVVQVPQSNHNSNSSQSCVTKKGMPSEAGNLTLEEYNILLFCKVWTFCRALMRQKGQLDAWYHIQDMLQYKCLTTCWVLGFLGFCAESNVWLRKIMTVEWTFSDDIGHVNSLDTPHSNEFWKYAWKQETWVLLVQVRQPSDSAMLLLVENKNLIYMYQHMEK
jgi:hypothetical protein